MSKYKNTSKSLIVFLIIVGIILLGSLYSKPAKAANEYLQGGQHCDPVVLEPYVELNTGENTNGNTYPGSSSNNYSGVGDQENLRVGVRLRISLGGTCTKKYRDTMLQNTLLRQQLEMLKMCARYKGLELGPEFGEVKRMCDGVSKGPTPVEEDDDDYEIPVGVIAR